MEAVLASFAGFVLFSRSSMNTIFAMRNTIRDYAWGHRSWIKEMVGQTMESPVIQAELWMGAHPGSSSSISVDGVWQSLAVLIASDPATWIGDRAVNQGFKGLPYLAKFLAADKPLSIQCHPSLEAAKKGFADEESRGIARDAENRNYKDANHKPEIICALTEFSALSGFRPGADIAADFKKLSARTKDQVSLSAFELCAGFAKEGNFSELTKTLLGLGSQASHIANEASRISAELAAEGGSLAFAELASASKYFPGDAGLFFFLVLNLFCMRPGEALYTPAGVLHAYVRGFGIEVMANSDNVLRGGLTPKYIDVPELLKNLDSSVKIKAVPCVQKGESTVYETPAPEFRLSHIPANPEARSLKLSNNGGPEILMCTKGRVWAVGSDDTPVDMFKGTSIFVRPNKEGIVLKLETDTELFRVELA